MKLDQAHFYSFTMTYLNFAINFFDVGANGSISKFWIVLLIKSLTIYSLVNYKQALEKISIICTARREQNEKGYKRQKRREEKVNLYL
jgi:hypothetical protein